jgi:hypothetical protein
VTYVTQKLRLIFIWTLALIGLSVASMRLDWCSLGGLLGLATCEVRGVVVHHTGMPSKFEGRLVTVAVLDRIHEYRGYSARCSGRTYHIGYHYLILPDGSIQRGRPDGCPGAHAGNRELNLHYLGIALSGDFTSGKDRPTTEQRAAFSSLIRMLQQRHGFSRSRVIRHDAVRPGTACPGMLDLAEILTLTGVRNSEEGT